MSRKTPGGGYFTESRSEQGGDFPSQSEPARMYPGPEKMRADLVELVKVQRAEKRRLSTAKFLPVGRRYELAGYVGESGSDWPIPAACFHEVMGALLSHLEKQCERVERREDGSIVDGDRLVLDIYSVKCQEWASDSSKGVGWTEADVWERIAAIPVVTFDEQCERWSMYNEIRSMVKDELRRERSMNEMVWRIRG